MVFYELSKISTIFPLHTILLVLVEGARNQMFLTRNLFIFPIQTSSSSCHSQNKNFIMLVYSWKVMRQETRSLRGPQNQKNSVKKDLDISKVSPFLLSLWVVTAIQVSLLGSRYPEVDLYWFFPHPTSPLSVPPLEGFPDGTCHKWKPRSD